MIRQSSSAAEALTLGQYLIGQSPPLATVDLYAQALSMRDDSMHEKALAAALRRPRLLPFLDAHDALFRPKSQLRQRLYLMFSILEATPDVSQKFLPTKRPRAYIVIAGLLGMRGVLRLVVGGVIVRVWGL